jgi:hypothetical protein
MDDCFALGNANSEIIDNINVPFEVKLQKSLLPTSIMTVYDMQNHVLRRPLTVLFDVGSAVTMVYPRALPKGCTPKKMELPITVQTGNGPITHRYGVTL